MKDSATRTVPAAAMGRQAGFTLVELMISSVIASIIIVAAAAFIARIGSQAAQMQRSQDINDNMSTALHILGQDIMHTGFGFPQAVPVQSPIELDQTQMRWIWQTVIQDADNGANNALHGFPSGHGGDALWLGGVGFDLSGTSSKVNFLVQDSGMGMPAIQMAHWTRAADGSVALDPLVSDGVLEEYLFFVSPTLGWRSQNGVRATAVFAPSPGVVEATVNPVLPVGVQAGDMVYHVRDLAPGELPPPWLMQQVVWFVDDNRNLTRRYIPDPQNSPGRFADLRVMRNVIDFQVAYQIWPCGGNGPVWVDDLIGHFTGGNYVPGLESSRIFMSMRQRLMAIRVSMLVEDTATASVLRTFFGGQDEIVLENNVNAVRTDRDHFLVSQTFDPINLRAKTGTGNNVSYPRILSQALDQRSRNAGGGICDARVGTIGGA